MNEHPAQSPGIAGRRSLWTARAGAISYMIWALFHLLAALAVYRLGGGLAHSMVRGRVLQDAFNLAAFSVVGFGVALRLNWRNDGWGYWINLGVIGVADVGFIVFILVPGYMPIWPGLVGPLFWGAGLALTSAARQRRSIL